MMDLRHSLYMEHLEEISALYEQRLWLMDHDRLKWFDFVDLEYRLELHIDALAESDMALALCGKQALEGDFGECYGAVRVLGRCAQYDMLKDLICRMDEADSKRMRGVSDALCHESTLPVHDDFFQVLLKKDAERARIAAQVISFHRLDFATELYDTLNNFTTDKAVVLDILYALGRLRPRYGRND